MKRMSGMDETVVIMKRVANMQSDLKQAIDYKMDGQAKSFQARINKIYEEELSMKGLFGPREEHKTLKEFIMQKLMATDADTLRKH